MNQFFENKFIYKKIRETDFFFNLMSLFFSSPGLFFNFRLHCGTHYIDDGQGQACVHARSVQYIYT